MSPSERQTMRLLRDSLAMENARTWDELQRACINIEARHAVEGVSDVDRAAYEAVKSQHAQRVIRVLVA